MPCARVSSPRSNASFLDRRRFKTQAEARVAVFEFIEGFLSQAFLDIPQIAGAARQYRPSLR